MRAGRTADVYACELLLPLRLSQTSAELSAPACAAPAAALAVWTTLSTAGMASLRPRVTMAVLERRVYASCLFLTSSFAADSYLPIDDAAALRVCVSDWLFPTRFGDTYTPATGAGKAMGEERRATMGVRIGRRWTSGGGWAGLWGRGAGCREGELRAPVTAPGGAHLMVALVRPRALHHTLAHHSPSSPFSSRVERGWCTAPGGSSWCRMPGAKPGEMACGV
jgi:hypothetical protein